MEMIRITLLLVSVSASVAVFGQTSKKYEKYLERCDYHPGYIETIDGNRTAGLLKEYSGYRVYSKVVFVSEQGEKNTYYPYQLNAYGTDYEEYESNRSSFLKVVDKANGIGLYQLETNRYPTAGSYGETPTTSVTYFIKRSGEEGYVAVERSSFQRIFGGYFSDCSRLQLKIADRSFTHHHAREVVEFYQYSCREQEAMNTNNGF